MTKNSQDIKQIREKCLSNAESFLAVAERELNKNVDHICFHLALLSLEEIGKAILVTIGFTVSVAGKKREGLVIALDDHVKKIFWALWGGMFRDNKFTKQAIEENRDLATTLHKRRLYYLYTDPNNPTDPDDRIEAGEAERLVKLVKARLEYEKTIKIVQKFEDADVENLKWFFKATEDPDKRKFIFGSASIKKLQEVQNGKEWISWMRGVFQKNEEEMRALAEKEIRRQKPSETKKFEPKYKMRVRVQSQSHSIRNNAFNKWNEGVRDIKIYKSDMKKARKTVKSEMLVDFIFPKAIPIHALWDHGFFMAKTFNVALNIATRGLFWWNVPKDIEKFYEEITDLEADKNESIKIHIAVNKRLSINWDEAKLVLNEEVMRQVSMMFAFLMREHKKLEKFLKTYAFGLTIFSKIDIHLRLEANAFDEFFKSLKSALLIFGDWDGKSDLKEAVHKQFAQLGDLQDLDKTIKLGVDMDLKKGKTPRITLTEVAAMKLYTDVYIQLKARDYFKNLKKIEK
jgi:AbiV family abortive infection protein